MRILPLTAQIAQEHGLEIARLYYDNMRACSFLEHRTFDDARKKIEDFIYHLEHGTCVGYGAFHEDGICGFVWAYPHQFREERRMYVSELRVAKPFRKRGIGTQLLELVERDARRMGIGALYLHAETDNPNAISLYESIGYEAERIQLRKELT